MIELILNTFDDLKIANFFNPDEVYFLMTCVIYPGIINSTKWLLLPISVTKLKHYMKRFINFVEFIKFVNWT